MYRRGSLFGKRFYLGALSEGFSGLLINRILSFLVFQVQGFGGIQGEVPFAPCWMIFACIPVPMNIMNAGIPSALALIALRAECCMG